MKNPNTALTMVATFEAMAKEKSTTLKRVVQWLASNINLLGQVLFDKPGRALTGHCTFQPNIAERDDIFYMDVEVRLPFSDRKKLMLPPSRLSSAPDLVRLEPYLKGVTFVSQGGRFSAELFVRATFDLRVWKCLIPSCLYLSIQLFDNESLCPDERALWRKNQDVIVENFYPELTPAMLYLAQELGILDNYDVFLDWISKMHLSGNCADSNLPQDF